MARLASVGITTETETMATITDKLNEVRAEIDDVTTAMQAVLDVAKEDGERELNEDEEKEFSDFEVKLANLKASEARHEKLQARQLAIHESRKTLGTPCGGDNTHRPSAETDQVESRIRCLTPRLHAFNGENAAVDAYNTLMFVRCLQAQRQNRIDEKAQDRMNSLGWIRADMTEGSDTAGGYTVPTPLATAIIAVRNKVGLTPQIARIVPMGSDTLDWPKRTGGLTVYYPGEAGAITESDPTFGRIDLVAKKRATLTQISNELLADSAIMLMDFLAEEIGNAFARQMDNEVVNGDATASFGGVSGLITGIGSAGNQDATSGDTSFADVLDADLDLFFNLLPERFNIAGNVNILCSRQCHAGVFQRLAKAAGVDFRGYEEGLGPSYNGWPIIFTDQLPTSGSASDIIALFGNFRESILMGDRGDMRVADSSDYGFNQDLISIRATHRYDVKIHEKGDGTNAGGYVSFTLAAS